MTNWLNLRATMRLVYLIFCFGIILNATAQSHLDVIKNTPCLLEYRSYVYGGVNQYNKSWNSEFSLPSNFTKEECNTAIAVNLRIQSEQAAHKTLLEEYARRPNEDDRSTECLYEYRIWLDKYSGSQSFEDALANFIAFKIYDRSSCVSAKQTHERFAAEKIASDIRLKRTAEVERKAEIQQQAKRDAFARRPGAKIGMTPEDVIERSNWGRPQKKNRTTTARGVSEQWVYGNGNYLYFENGRLTAIQN